MGWDFSNRSKCKSAKCYLTGCFLGTSCSTKFEAMRRKTVTFFVWPAFSARENVCQSNAGLHWEVRKTTFVAHFRLRPVPPAAYVINRMLPIFVSMKDFRKGYLYIYATKLSDRSTVCSGSSVVFGNQRSESS